MDSSLGGRKGSWWRASSLGLLYVTPGHAPPLEELYDLSSLRFMAGTFSVPDGVTIQTPSPTKALAPPPPALITAGASRKAGASDAGLKKAYKEHVETTMGWTAVSNATSGVSSAVIAETNHVDAGANGDKEAANEGWADVSAEWGDTADWAVAADETSRAFDDFGTMAATDDPFADCVVPEPETPPVFSPARTRSDMRKHVSNVPSASSIGAALLAPNMPAAISQASPPSAGHGPPLLSVATATQESALNNSTQRSFVQPSAIHSDESLSDSSSSSSDSESDSSSDSDDDLSSDDGVDIEIF
jgi:hypothetical protein